MLFLYYHFYGNNSSSTSRQKAWLDLKVSGVEITGSYIRVIPSQNFTLLMGDDWLRDNDLCTSPRLRSVFQIPAEGLAPYVVHCNLQSLPGLSMGEELFTGIPEEIVDILTSMPSLYDESEVQTLTTAPVVHRIETGDANPVVSRGRRLSPKENDVVDQEVEKLLKKGVIRPSKSPWCAKPVVVPKPDGSSRFCSNFRALDMVTIKDKYPLPRMTELIDRLAGSVYFNAIDLKSAYFQLPILEEHKEKTAFATRKGLFEYNFMAQGLSNLPPSFCRFMDNILESVSSFTIVYLDDILCFAKTREESIEQARQVLSTLHQWNMKISCRSVSSLNVRSRFWGSLYLAQELGVIQQSGTYQAMAYS